jgi:hypothetical protein
VGELVGEKAAQVAQDLQGVLVYGVDMEQVVLHLADDLAEVGQIAASMPNWFMRRSSCSTPRGC